MKNRTLSNATLLNKCIPVYSLILEIIKHTSAEVNTQIDHNTPKVCNHVMRKWVCVCTCAWGQGDGSGAKGELKMKGGVGGGGG